MLIARNEEALQELRSKLLKRRSLETGTGTFFDRDEASPGTGDDDDYVIPEQLLHSRTNEDERRSMVRKDHVDKPRNVIIVIPCDLRDSWTPNLVLNELKRRGNVLNKVLGPSSI